MIDIREHGIGAGGKGAGMNVFCQPTEPAGKEGIWVQSPFKQPVKKVVVDESPFTAGDYNLGMRKTMLGDLKYGTQFSRPIVYNGKIYVFGGYDTTNNYSSRLYSYDIKTNVWSLLTTYQTPLMAYAVGAYNNKLYFLNGATNSSSVTGYCFIYDIATNTFSTSAGITINQVKGASFHWHETDKSIYFYGGYTVSNNVTLQAGRLDLTSGLSVNLPTGIFNSNNTTKGSSIAVVNGKMYIMGGVPNAGTDPLKVTRVINLNNNTWDADVAVIPTNVLNSMATVYKGEIYVFGGQIIGSGYESSLVQIYNPTTNTWRMGKNAPMPFSDTSPCVENGCAYIVTSYATMKYDFFTDSWEKFFSLKVPAFGVRPAVVGNKIVIPYLGDGQPTGLMYDFVENVGEVIPSMPNTRSTNYAITTHGGKVYVGATGSNYFSRYDPINNKWAELAVMPFNTAGGSLVALGDNIYYMGGATTNSMGFAKYDIALNKWNAMDSPLPFADKYNNVFCVYNDWIYAFINNLDTANTVVFRYDFSSKVWANYATMNNCRGIYKNGVVVGSKAYLFGGGDPNSNASMSKLVIFDFSSGLFTYGKDMPVPKMHAGVCLAGNEIYIVGGQLTYSSAPYSSTAEIYSLVSKKYNDNDIVLKKTSNYYGNYSAVLYDNKNLSGAYNRLLTTFDDVYLYKNDNLNTYPAYYGDGTKWIKFK